MYKKIIVIIIISFFLSSLILTTSIISLANNSLVSKDIFTFRYPKSDKHPIFVEYFTEKNNIDNSIVSNHLYNLFANLYKYSSDDNDFYFITLLTDVVADAKIRAQDYNIQQYPVVFFDGGYKQLYGKQNTFDSYLDAVHICQEREASNVQIEDIEAIWVQVPCQKNILTDITIKNNGEIKYNGNLMISVVIIDSQWLDNSNRPFNYVIIGYIANEKISIGTGIENIYKNHFDWFPSDLIEINICDIYNFFVIATIFSEDTGFVDDTKVDRLVKGEQPTKPTSPIGKMDPIIKNSYEYKTSSTDPEGGQIRYLWDWDGDYIADESTKNFNSGEEAIIYYTWDQVGNNMVRVKAKDEYNIESFWSDPLLVSVIQPKQPIYYKYFNNFKNYINNTIIHYIH
jgi:hypothetical protein